MRACARAARSLLADAIRMATDLDLMAARSQALSRASASWVTTTIRRALRLWSFMRQSTPKRRWTAAARCWVRPGDARHCSARHICHCLHPDRLLHTGSLPLRVSPSKAPVRDEAPTR